MDTRLIFGIQAVRQALMRGRVDRIYMQADLGPKRFGRLAQDLDRAAAPIALCPAAELERLTGSGKHQGIAAVIHGAAPLTEREAREFIKGLTQPLLLVLDGIQDPRNFGSVLRTADAAGVDLVVIARSRNVSVTPVVSKVACGAAEAQALACVGNLARFLEHVAEQGIRTIGTDHSADASLFDADLTGPVALIMGGEGEGMRRLTRERCDSLVQLPMQGVVESLNIAVAAGICLYECLRQRSRLAPGETLR